MGEANLLISSAPLEHGATLSWCAVSADPARRASPALRARLRSLADRLVAAEAEELRSRPIPAAYRRLYTLLGVDPDVERVPAERYMLERLKQGGYRSRGVLRDACLIATVETSVHVSAADAVPASAEAVFDAPSVASHEFVLFSVVPAGVPAVAVSEALWIAWDVVAGA